MSTEKPRLARLIAIVTWLQSKRIITANEIADKYGVSIRTVYRDIRTLEASGIPVTTIDGKGYSMMANYRVPPVMFSEEEAHALITAEQLISENTDRSLVEHYKSATRKIKAVLPTEKRDKTEFIAKRLLVRAMDSSTSDYLITLQKQIADFRVVNIRYLSLEYKVTNRDIEPFALYTTNNNWVLIAYCRFREAFRAFRLDRIQSLVVQNDYFESHNMTLLEYYESHFETPDTHLSS